jgi:hypothetical protein
MASHRPDISAHRLVGNGRTVLLLRPDAHIDWWCAPAFDSAPLCWSLLDAGGGAARFVGARYASASSDPAGRTARTQLQSGGGRIEVWDALLPTPGEGDDDGVALVRLVRGLDGDLDVTHELALGGFGVPRRAWSLHGGHATSDVGKHGVRAAGGTHSLGGDGALLSRLVAPTGAWAALVVSVDGDLPGGLGEDPAALAGKLGAADREELRAASHTRLPREHPGRARDALAVLRACTYEPTGAVVASPTTSLPEAPGGDRQFDYRFTWLRDASLAVAVAALVGRGADASRYLSYVRQVAAGEVPHQPVTDVRGYPVPDEREVPGVAGWAGSTPVRVGNGAAGQVQYDALGLMVEAVSVHVQTGGVLDDDTWRMVADLADQTARDHPERVLPSNGIWELRETGPLVDGDIGRWLVLDRALWLARLRHPLRRRRRWKRARATIAARVTDSLTPQGGLPQAYGQHPPQVDASALMAVVFGLLPGRDPRASRLVDAVLAALDAYPFLYRYEPGGDDGFHGAEGAFLPVSAWAVSALATVGRVSEARERLDDLCSRLPRLLAEEIDPVGGSALGNVPLVWSHMELTRALYVLDAAELRRRYGRLVLGAWRVRRYLRLRRDNRRRDDD